MSYTLEENIMELVESLNDIGIETIASCEGHTDWALPYPWVDIKYHCLPKVISILEGYKKGGVLIQIRDGEDYMDVPENIMVRILPYHQTIEEGRNDFNNLVEYIKTHNEV